MQVIDFQYFSFFKSQEQALSRAMAMQLKKSFILKAKHLHLILTLVIKSLQYLNSNPPSDETISFYNTLFYFGYLLL